METLLGKDTVPAVSIDACEAATFFNVHRQSNELLSVFIWYMG